MRPAWVEPPGADTWPLADGVHPIEVRELARKAPCRCPRRLDNHVSHARSLSAILALRRLRYCVGTTIPARPRLGHWRRNGHPRVGQCRRLRRDIHPWRGPVSHIASGQQFLRGAVSDIASEQQSRARPRLRYGIGTTILARPRLRHCVGTTILARPHLRYVSAPEILAWPRLRYARSGRTAAPERVTGPMVPRDSERPFHGTAITHSTALRPPLLPRPVSTLRAGTSYQRYWGPEPRITSRVTALLQREGGRSRPTRSCVGGHISPWCYNLLGQNRRQCGSVDTWSNVPLIRVGVRADPS